MKCSIARKYDLTLPCALGAKQSLCVLYSIHSWLHHMYTTRKNLTAPTYYKNEQPHTSCYAEAKWMTQPAPSLGSWQKGAHYLIMRLSDKLLDDNQLVVRGKSYFVRSNKLTQHELHFKLKLNQPSGIKHAQNFTLTIAKCIPRHVRWPTPKGKYANGLGLKIHPYVLKIYKKAAMNEYLLFSGSNREGLKVSGLSKYSGLR